VNPSGARRQVVLLASDGPSTRIVYHALAKEYPGMQVILEETVSRYQFLRRRVKKLGLGTVAGQVMFMLLINPVLRRTGARRIDSIKRESGLDDSAIDSEVIRVPSVNADETRRVLRQLDPEVVVINGTRIIGRETLSAVAAPFINMHAGITPLYRGVHGGYWALAEGRPDLAGTTVHLVDEGIDTGSVIEQVKFSASREDSFATYPYLHTAAGIPILVKAVRKALERALETRQPADDLPSKLRYHPTFWGYLITQITKGVK
jgi:folate-dependent phosphoribosylglycinamide formyltransferase PurN